VRAGLRELAGTPGGAPAALVEVMDEREPLAEAALSLIEGAFRRLDRQPTAELRSEIAEKRLELLTALDFHLLVALSSEGEAMGTISGLYLEGVNAGFVTYLAVAPRFQGRRVAPALRTGLVQIFREDARRAGFPELDWVLGEVRRESRWLQRLLEKRGVHTFHLQYFHPGMTPGTPHDEYILYRQPVGDHRPELPVPLVRRILYAIYRRGYRVRYPLQRPGFQHMLEELEGRETVGPFPGLEAR